MLLLPVSWQLGQVLWLGDSVETARGLIGGDLREGGTQLLDQDQNVVMQETSRATDSCSVAVSWGLHVGHPKSPMSKGFLRLAHDPMLAFHQ